MSSYYSYKDCAVNLSVYDGFSGESGFSGVNPHNQLRANRVSISYNAQISPKYLSQERHSFKYVADDGLQGDIQLNYYMTGNDPFRSILDLDVDRTLDLNFNGLYFNSGYLKSYSFNGRPNEPIVATANLVFFSPPTGNFTPHVVAGGSITGNVLNMSDVTIDTSNTSEPITNIKSFDYNYNAEINPSYLVSTGGVGGALISNLGVHHVVFGPKTTEVNIIRDDLLSGLALTGHLGRIKVTLGHPYVDGITENYDISGSIYSKNYEVSPGSNLEAKISIKQNHLGTFPEFIDITYFDG